MSTSWFPIKLGMTIYLIYALTVSRDLQFRLNELWIYNPIKDSKVGIANPDQQYLLSPINRFRRFCLIPFRRNVVGR